MHLGSHRKCRLEPAVTAQQFNRCFHRLPGPGGIQLAATARCQRVQRVRHQPCHAGQQDLIPFQPHGFIHDLLHGLLRGTERAACGNECAGMRRLRTGACRCRYLSGQRQVEQQFQPHGCHKPGRHLSLLRCTGQRLHAFGRVIHICRQASGGGRKGRRQYPCSHRVNCGQRRRVGGRDARSGTRPVHQRANPACPSRAHARGCCPCRPPTGRIRLP